MRERILITGPGGRVGKYLVPLLRQEFSLRLLDAKLLKAEEDDEVVQADIQNLDAFKAACAGVKALVHLAAISDEDDFMSKLLPGNVVGAYNAYEAARHSGVKVIFASTAQTVLYYPKGQWITTDMPVRPWTVYACTKVFGETLGRYYSDAHGMSVNCLRICWFQNYDSEQLAVREDMMREWVSPRDLAQLVTRCIRSDVKFGIFFGVSNNTGRYWDVSNATKLVGYEPQDDSVNYCKRGNLGAE
jgi:NAD+ dependent glucose-6-phosphate dehydrogenase